MESTNPISKINTSFRSLTVDDKEKIISPNLKKIEKGEQQISSDSVNERKLFFECSDGNLEKYKFCVKIETSNLHHVLIGVTSSCFQYSFYIIAKNSDDSITTFFIDQNTKYQFESALASFIETGVPNKLEIYEVLHKPTMQWKTEKMCFH